MSASLRLLGRTMGIRAGMLPLQVGATTLTTFLTIRSIGVEAYATVGLLVGLQGLFGFLNLGTSAAVSSAAGESLALGVDHLIRVSVSATRMTFLAGAILIPLSGIVALLGWWPEILGMGDPKLLTFGALVATVAVAVLQPLSQGINILMATGRTLSATALTIAPSFVTLVLIFGATLCDSPPIVFVICVFLAQVAAAIMACAVATHTLGFSLRGFIGSVIDKGFRGSEIRHESRPALVMWILLPLAFQTDRLLISHLSTSSQLASYNVAAQIFTALFSIVAVASSSLWGHYANARITVTLPAPRAFSRLSLVFAGVGGILGIGYVIATPLVVALVSGRQVTVSFLTLICFSALLVVQSFHQPSAMLQTDKPGLWFNAGAVAVMTVVNLGLGLLLTRPLGAAGPVLASVFAVTFALALPSFVRARSILGGVRCSSQISQAQKTK